MARTRSAEDIVSDCRKRAAMENSDLLTDEEILEIFNQEATELAIAIRQAEGQPHNRTLGTIAVVVGTSSYSLPSDFWELLGIEAVIGGLNRRLEPFMENERAGLTNSQILGTVSSPMYRIEGSVIEFLPATLTFTASIKYVPGATRLTLGQTPPATYDGFNGYEMVPIYGTVAVMKDKEESDPSFYEGRKARLMTQIKAIAAQRDAGAPERVSDVTGGLDNEISFRRY